ncbi:MAG: hypothetical protein GY847_26895 [Proteobacteria bacterium]|nr:hypothetical protein [Pseudomonadota bacterium]
MFWKLFELLIRLVYFKRFRQADKIGNAAELARNGKLNEALLALDNVEPGLNSFLKPVYGLTRGRILSAQGRLGEAEKALIIAAKADPSNFKVHLDLALIAGRRFRFDDARDRLKELATQADDATKKEAAEILALLEKVTSGEREADFESRARAMANKVIGPHGEVAGLPVDTARLDAWIDRNPEEARKSADEIALLLGQGEILEQRARWKVGLSIEESYILRLDSTVLNPFEVVAMRLNNNDANLKVLINNGWIRESIFKEKM